MKLREALSTVQDGGPIRSGSNGGMIPDWREPAWV